MKTILIQGASGDYLPMLHKIFPSQAAYCQRHDITYAPFFGRIDHARHPNFDRFTPMISALNNFDMMIWMDADALVVDKDTDLRDCADEFTHLGLAAHPEPWENMGFHFNCGVMYFRNTPQSREFLFEVDRLGHVGGSNHWQNQNTVHVVIGKGIVHVDRIRNRWNCCDVNNVPRPVVRAFHGRGLEEAMKGICGCVP